MLTRYASVLPKDMIQPSQPVREYCIQRGFAARVCNEGLDYLLATWQRTVCEILEGYRGLFDEYLNDMDGRQIISELVPLATEAERKSVLDELSLLDHSFFKVTRSLEACIWGADQAARHGYEPNENWWYYRIPQNLDSAEDRDAWPQ